MFITSGGNIIQGLQFESTGRAILIYGPQASGNIVVGNTFGVTAAGTRQSYNAGYASIMIDGAAEQLHRHAQQQRGRSAGRSPTATSSRAASTASSSTTRAPTTTSSRTTCIGVSPDGSAQWGGCCTGIDHNVGPKSNLIGGTIPAQRNVIDGWGCDGTEWSHGWNQETGDSSLTYQVNDNFIMGNYLGIRADGTYSPSFINAPGNNGTNDGSSVNIWDIANHNTVSGNYMAANQNGVRVAHNTNSNIIIDNSIGILPDGSASFIGTNGVQIQAALLERRGASATTSATPAPPAWTSWTRTTTSRSSARTRSSTSGRWASTWPRSASSTRTT